jgi:hypothetical protein
MSGTSAMVMEPCEWGGASVGQYPVLPTARPTARLFAAAGRLFCESAPRKPLTHQGMETGDPIFRKTAQAAAEDHPGLPTPTTRPAVTSTRAHSLAARRRECVSVRYDAPIPVDDEIFLEGMSVKETYGVHRPNVGQFRRRHTVSSSATESEVVP